MNDTKRAFRHTILSPGYHLFSRYDLKNLRWRKSERAKKRKNIALPLASMVDIFAILVIFLILNFSTTGEVSFVNKNIQLPQALNAQTFRSFPLIVVTRKGVFLDEERTETLSELQERLREIQVLKEKTDPKNSFRGRVNLQADKNTPMIKVKKVMKALVAEGWTEIYFATRAR